MRQIAECLGRRVGKCSCTSKHDAHTDEEGMKGKKVPGSAFLVQAQEQRKGPHLTPRQRRDASGQGLSLIHI